jgi:hypothetical protein
MSGRTSIKVSTEVLELLDKCVDEYLRHHPEMKHMFISRDKILYEITTFYLKV